MGINEYIKIGEKMKEARIKSGYSQKEAAQKLGLSPSAYSNYENNHREPSMAVLYSFCELVGCNISDLVMARPSEEHYYLDEQAREAAEFLHKNPDYRVLFDASRKVKKEDIEFVKQMIDRFSE